MKYWKIILSLLLALAMLCALCACGTKPEAAEQPAEAEPTEEPVEEPAEEPEEEPSPEPEEEPVLPTEGEYILFGVESEGYLVDSGEMEMSSVITLGMDGAGVMTMDDDSMNIASWTEEDGAVTLTLEDESYAEAVAENGILILDILGDGSMLLYYAQEGADTSAYPLMTVDELLAAYMDEMPDTRVSALYAEIDAGEGAHLSYTMHSDDLDSDSSFDVYARDGAYYSRCTTSVSDTESTTVTFFRDGIAYSLYPDEMRGTVAAATSSSVIEDNVLLMDGLYAIISQTAQQADFTEETREVDGVSYTVEVYEAPDEDQSACAFYFDDEGELAYVLESPAVSADTDAGESFYTVRAIDGEVDEALFDISGYDIEE